MNPDQIRSAVQVFLALLRDTKLTPEEAETTLLVVLDRLALAVHYAPDPSLRAVIDSTAEYELRRSLAQNRFPQLGLYPTINAGGLPGSEQAEVGDAHDDLADIYGDLSAVEALWAAGQDRQALESFAALFHAHWGQHLRDLQLYLHARATRG